MTLSYDFTRVKDYDSICLDSEGKLHALTYALIISTQSIGMSEITHENAPEFYARLRVLERISGTILDDEIIKPVDVNTHVRLKTNAVDVPYSKWAAQVLDDLLKRNKVQYHQCAVPLGDDSKPGTGVIS